ncbi:T3SS effector HopA1 family protein [Streptomyces sp. NPDC005322]|uniref:T3SS effector HopA1 family protein n=1 Tax=Streptomyces sp. NPDC005322 TaxID=3157032 RepID=UPI0033B84CBC
MTDTAAPDVSHNSPVSGHGPLDPGLAAVLDGVTLAPDGLHATVDGRELTAETGRQLRQELIGAVYEAFHVGHVFGEQRPRSFRDPWLEERLAARTPHTTTPVPAVPYRPEGEGAGGADSRIAVIGGLRVRLTGAREFTDGTVRLPAARPGLSPGFFLVDGSRGTTARGAVLRLYLQLDDPDEAIRLWGGTLRHLEDAGVGYRAKVTSSRQLFPRRDGLVVYLGRDAWDIVPGLVEEVRQPAKAGREEPASPFAKSLAPGVAIAWEPRDERPGRRGMSFGQHRAAAVVDALFDTLEGRPGEIGRSPDECLIRRLKEANIDPAAVYRNADSPNPGW